MELGTVLVPAVVYALGAELDLRQAFALRWARPSAMLAGVVVAAGMCAAGTVILRLQEAFAPISTTDRVAWEALFDEASAAPIVAVVALAIAPAVAEEALFRGVLLHRLQREFGRSGAVIVGALLFGLFHRSGYRFFAQALLGLLLGWLVIRSSSLVPAIVGHLAYNLGILGASDLLAGEIENRQGEAARR